LKKKVPKRTKASFFARYGAAMKMSQATFFRQLKKYLDSKENGTEYKRTNGRPRAVVEELLGDFESHLLQAQARIPLTVHLVGLEWIKFVADLEVSQTQRDFYVKNAGGEQFCYTMLNRMRNKGTLLTGQA
jgi:hypothetical protein